MTDTEAQKAMKEELSKLKVQLAKLQKDSDAATPEMREELKSLRALAARRRWVMPKSFGMLDESKFLEQLYEKVRFGSYDTADVSIALICRHRLILIKEEYDAPVPTHVENVLRKKFDKFSSEEDVEAAVTAALVDMRGAAKRKAEHRSHPSGSNNRGGGQGNFRRPRRS